MAPIDPRSDRIVRRTAMVGAATAAFLLLTADYGPNYPNPIKKAMESTSFSLKDLVFMSDRNARGKKQESSESDGKK